MELRRLGRLQASFPWGLLVVSDAASDLKVPDPARPEQKMSSSLDAAVIEVLHSQFGEVVVSVWVDGVEPSERQAVDLGSCEMDIPSGELIVGDVERNAAISIPLNPGRYIVRVQAEAQAEPEIVNLILEKHP